MDTLLQIAASWILPALFFWFLFSLIAMILIEFIQRFRQSRQKGLQEVIRIIMGDDLAKEFYEHALVNPLGDAMVNPRRKAKPSYISPSLFAKVIMDWILPKAALQAQNKKPDIDVVNKGIQSQIKSLAKRHGPFGEVLQAIVLQAHMKTEKLSEFLDAIQKDLETWFWETVNQMTPIYGARLQGLTIWISLAVAAVANFDVIDISVRLWETSKYTELLNLAEKTKQAVHVDPELMTMLPVGWYSRNLPNSPIEWLVKVVGLYLGAFFIAVGSQYVYNLTKKQYKPSK